MPPSARRTGLRSRRDADPQQQSDADTPDSIATPSRKRRRLNGASEPAPAPADPPRSHRPVSVASNDSNTTLPNGDDDIESASPVERQNLLIASLRVPHYTSHATLDYANDLQVQRHEGKEIPAFAKIAARDWCFFVKETRVCIGRANTTEEGSRTQRPASQADASGLPAPVSDFHVHIDLGPERQISRIHAEIIFEPESQGWFIVVNSRNGLKLDDRNLFRGAKEPLHSGVCISISGTQMLFLIASTEDSFHPMLYRQLKNEDAADSDHDGNPPPKAHPHAHPGGPTPKREQYDPFPPSSHPRNKQQSSQAYYNNMTSTPGRPQPGTPLFRNERPPHSKGSPAAFAGEPMGGEGDLRFSLDSARDEKPPYSYAQLIGQAILSSEEQMLTLSNIYDFIKIRYAYFRNQNGGWQNSIRHNLSLNKSFEKVARRTDEPGKGMKWRIADSERDEFIKKQMLNPRKGGGISAGHRLDGSGPSSPALGDHRGPASQATDRLVGALEHDRRYQSRVESPNSATPPMSSVPMATESYTPDRGPRPYAGFKQSPNVRDQHHFITPAKRLVYGNEGGREPNYVKNDPSRGLESSPAVDPVKPNVGLQGNATNSPPTLYSETAPAHMNGNHDAGRMNHPLQTPLVTRHAPRLAPPSAAHLPSHFVNFSSPAGFWKFVDFSTPAKGVPGISPLKLPRPDEKDDEEMEDEGEDAAQPSSPPLLNDEGASAEPDDDDAEDIDAEEKDDEEAGPESPSRTVSRPVSRREMGSQHSRSNSNINGFGLATGNGGMVRGASLTSFDEEPEAEEESYDLSKGFQKIGSFHRSIAQAHGLGISHATAAPPPPPARTSVPANH